jgi:hypothetical protein
MRTHLRRTRTDTKKWNLLFLLRLPEGGPVLHDALTDQLWALHRRVLQPLQEHHNQEPGRAVAVVVDALQRESSNHGPCDPAARLRWKLDRWGYAPSVPGDDTLGEHPGEALNVPACIFCQDDLAKLTSAWSPEFLEHDFRNDDFGHLSSEQQNTLKAARRDTHDAATALWKEKREAASTFAGAGSDEALPRVATPEALEETWQAFFARLGDLSDATLEEWKEFDPAGAAREALAQTLSLASVRERFALLRFCLEREPLVRLQRGKVQLTYLVATLATPGADDLRRRLARGTRYALITDDTDRSRGVTLAEQDDAPSMATVAGAYPPRLQATAQRV